MSDTHAPGPFPITRRQAQIVELVAEGLTDRAIAARLSLSPRTVSNYLADLYALSGATNRVHLVRLYLTGALTPTPPRGRAGSPR